MQDARRAADRRGVQAVPKERDIELLDGGRGKTRHRNMPDVGNEVQTNRTPRMLDRAITQGPECLTLLEPGREIVASP